MNRRVLIAGAVLLGLLCIGAGVLYVVLLVAANRG